MDDYIHFYGSDNLSLFEIERRAMDRQGRVIAWLNKQLPAGRILDVGAGNGFTAARLTSNRQIVCAEPSLTLPNFELPLIWVRASAESLPFHDGYFAGAYSTWAYFLPGVDKRKGLAEVTRTIADGGKIIVIDNAGNDEFTSFSDSDRDISSDRDFYRRQGFDFEIIDTSFEFDSPAEAEQLMTAFFGKQKMAANIKQSYQFRVIAYSKIISRSNR